MVNEKKYIINLLFNEIDSDNEVIKSWITSIIRNKFLSRVEKNKKHTVLIKIIGQEPGDKIGLRAADIDRIMKNKEEPLYSILLKLFVDCNKDYFVENIDNILLLLFESINKYVDIESELQTETNEKNLIPNSNRSHNQKVYYTSCGNA